MTVYAMLNNIQKKFFLNNVRGMRERDKKRKREREGERERGGERSSDVDKNKMYKG